MSQPEAGDRHRLEGLRGASGVVLDPGCEPRSQLAQQRVAGAREPLERPAALAQQTRRRSSQRFGLVDEDRDQQGKQQHGQHDRHREDQRARETTRESHAR